jgi:outer membrane protein assembly factor BamA
MRFGGRVAGYIRFTDKGLALALSLAAGLNVQLTDGSKTYPDRLFYLGGFDTIRGFLSDSVIPQDVADTIRAVKEGQPAQHPTIDDVAVRGGDFSINPRAELRIPLTDTFQLAAFLDAGNLWVDPWAIKQFELLYAVSAGLRVNTPIGPLAFDYGFNLDGATRKTKLNEDIGALHFSIGLF